MTGAELQTLVHRIADELTGDWLLVGGGAVALWLGAPRVTEDLDLVGVPGTMEQRYQLLELCLKLGVPVEAVNSAADFFIKRIDDWQTQCVLLHQGARGRILRPTTTLFVLLKMGRLSESDLADCELWLRSPSSEPADKRRLNDAMTALPATSDQSLLARRLRLTALLR